ncbi:MAG: 4-hydroxy-3-methylbut-2-en-1-yl diphosphate synthase [Caldilineaceae bacterium SB0665_bin_21]|nr:4-hydroxy-3-methylbut-2-en-1-yl diphosphate synthase [Caldilineaceae bacterium SB0665_bin_21]MYA04138.1 4-hydroxy-3-methylbut-2-en-1-yl diphosphate synthase [Caldilineaceae bacterium SB0664_bin_22]MYC61506.1 4-hydroxy-3-methylbut-2-en-1-yl diphosphate synthase [Caldilineaceae bacterium SB0661_bin_34]
MYEGVAAFRARLDRDELQIGASITLNDPAVTDALGPSVDFFWIDLEHSPMSIETLAGHIRAARLHEAASLVRVPVADIAWIKRVLDAGAEGIIVPQVQDAVEAQAVADAAKYPPWGRRGFGPRVPSAYGRNANAALAQRANDMVFAAVQIERQTALAEIEDIAAIAGLDAIALGPWDLAADLGHVDDVRHPEVETAIQRVIDVARRVGKPVGSGMGDDPALALDYARRGVQWIQVGNDVDYLIRRMDQVYEAVKPA